MQNIIYKIQKITFIEKYQKKKIHSKQTERKPDYLVQISEIKLKYMHLQEGK